MITDDISLWRDEYEKIEPFYERYGIYIVGKSNKTGVIRRHDNASEYIVPIEYDKIEVLFSGSHMLIAQKSGQYRIMKITKNTKTMSPFYDKIGPFYRNAFAPVYRDGVMGVIDSKGEEVIPVQYDKIDDRAFSIFPIDNYGGYAIIVKKGDKFGIFKYTGELLLPFEYDEIDHEGIFYRLPEYKIKNKMLITPSDCWFITALIPVKKNGAWGLVNSKFKLVVPCIYRAIRQDSVNKLKLLKKKGHDLLVMTKDGPQIAYTETNKLEQYSSVRKFKNGFAIVRKDKKYGYINEDYDEIVPCIFDKALPFEYGCACVRKDGKYGYINEKGTTILPFVYDEVWPFERGISIIKKGELYGAINSVGKMVIPLEYQMLADFSLFGPVMLMAVKDKRIGVIDAKNKTILPFEFDEALPMFGMITVTMLEKKGVYDYKGRLIVPIEYDDIEHPSMNSTTINVCKDGKWGVLNKKGEVICEPRYDKIDSFGFACGRLAVCSNNKWGFINRKGREVIECIYDEVIQFFEENHCEVKLNGKKMTINIQGERIG